MNHIQIEALPYCAPVRKWLMERYGKEANWIWEKTVQNYVNYLRDLPDYGGKKNGHARAIYGGTADICAGSGLARSAADR